MVSLSVISTTKAHSKRVLCVGACGKRFWVSLHPWLMCQNTQKLCSKDLHSLTQIFETILFGTHTLFHIFWKLPIDSLSKNLSWRWSVCRKSTRSAFGNTPERLYHSAFGTISNKESFVRSELSRRNVQSRPKRKKTTTERLPVFDIYPFQFLSLFPLIFNVNLHSSFTFKEWTFCVVHFCMWCQSATRITRFLSSLPDTVLVIWLHNWKGLKLDALWWINVSKSYVITIDEVQFWCCVVLVGPRIVWTFTRQRHYR